MKRKAFSILLALVMVFTFMPAMAFAETAPAAKALSNTDKNSTYGFFLWLSENAATASEKEDAAIAAQIISNTLTEANKSKVFNSGNIYGGSHDISYADLLASVDRGAENDATSLACLRDAVSFVKLGNTYRAKESLSALKISSAMMAMAELNVDYQDINNVFDHSSVFSGLENLAYRQLGGTWQYGQVGGGSSDDPYEGWYTEEKKNYDSNSGETGHYLTLTDRQGKMLLTGFGVRSRYATHYLTASDGKQYECIMHDKYYSQMFSTKSGMYSVGNGVTPDAYLAYIDKYECEVTGHKWGAWQTTVQPTATHDGERQRTCSSCGAVETEVLPKLDTPEITSQPQNVSVEAGSKATFKVTAEGEGLKYQWQWKSGSRDWANTTLSGYNTNTLSFTATEAHHGRQYRCVVTGSSGKTAESDAAKLTIKTDGPKITGQPASVSVAAGSKATFKVTATGLNLKYQWQWKSGSRAWANTSLSGYNTNTLSFTVQEAHNGRQYRCIVTDANGVTAQSNAATLTVPTDGPKITAQPKAVSVAEGAKATFKVAASGTGLKYQWQWKSGSRDWANTTLSGYNTNTLSFTAQAAHSGRQYRCVVTDANGKKAESSGAKLTVSFDGPDVTVQPKDVTVKAGEKATFKVTATGTGLKYQWQWTSGSRDWANTTLSGYNTNTLSFTAQDAHAGRRYRCVITDANGNAIESQAAKLTVTKDLVISEQPEDVTVRSGAKATFKVKASGIGLKYQWQWKSGKREWANTTMTGYNTDTLTFTTQDAHNGRQYRCVITDANGNEIASEEAVLTLTGVKAVEMQDEELQEETEE